MIDVSDIVSDGELMAPQPFQILRSSGQWVLGGFQSTVNSIYQVGPVQRASDKEVQMLPEADRVGGVMAFWCTIPVYVTRGTLPDFSASFQVPQGVRPTNVFILNGTYNFGTVTLNGLLQIPGLDYVLVGGILMMNQTIISSDVLSFVSPEINAADNPAASDLLVYPPNGEQYRVLSVRHYPGSGYWKALGTRLSAI